MNGISEVLGWVGIFQSIPNTGRAPVGDSLISFQTTQVRNRFRITLPATTVTSAPNMSGIGRVDFIEWYLPFRLNSGRIRSIHPFRWTKANGIFEGAIWKTGPHLADVFPHPGKDHTYFGIPPG
jgi:hypothetical protein